jgi:hypothetical protein
MVEILETESLHCYRDSSWIRHGPKWEKAGGHGAVSKSDSIFAAREPFRQARQDISSNYFLQYDTLKKSKKGMSSANTAPPSTHMPREMTLKDQ